MFLSSELGKNFVGRMEQIACSPLWDITQIIKNVSPWDEGLQDTSDQGLRFLSEEANVLIVGAGGLGCEILKCLAMSGFRRMCVIDMDNIDISNLNRQFLFRSGDVGKPKAAVAAECMNRRFGHLGVHVEHKVGRIQDLDESFYSRFMIVIAGLDNIPARRWLNSTLHAMVTRDGEGNVDPGSIKFLLDGGTEGFKGQARVIIPTMTACFECTLDTFPPVTTYPLCTIAETPRLPEHCIEYAFTVLFDKTFPGRAFNADDPKDIDWLFETALARAESFGITGVTRQLAKGVVKRIIPAVASTNALVAAVLVNEAFKIATYSNPVMSNYFMYIGQTGVNAQTIAYEKKEHCLVCGLDAGVSISIPGSASLQDLMDRMAEHPDLRLKEPSITCGQSVIFMQKPPSLRQQLEQNLRKSLDELNIATKLVVTDPVLRGPITVSLQIL